MADNNILGTFRTLILTVAWGGVVVMIYSCIVLIWRNRKQHNNPQLPQATVITIENQTVKLIPRHKLEEGNAFLDEECAVCLSEFKEGEEVGTLSECTHSFHVSCIEMWLYSNPNCPVCRANVTPMPPPQVWCPPSRIDDV